MLLILKINRYIKKILDKFIIEYRTFRKYFYISKWQLLCFFLRKNNILKRNEKICVVNFLITSKAEIRVFTPIINFILENKTDIKANIFFTCHYRFDYKLTKKILTSNIVKIRNDGYFLLKSFIYKNIVNVVCLDHLYYVQGHKIGIEIVGFLNRNNAKTICIQHGGNQEDNIIGQASSLSIFQIVFGKLFFDKLLGYGFDRNKIYLTGNPQHDNLFNKQYIYNRKDKRKIISLITCLHTEYNDRINPKKCYEEYLKVILQSIDYNQFFLIIKMHPNDSLNPNIYEKIANELELNDTKVKIFESGDENISVYELILISELIISRSSSIIEEGLMIGKKVIAYDLFEDGPSIHYDFLNRYKLYKKVTGVNEELSLIVNDFINEEIDDDDVLDEIVVNTSYKLDGKSSERVIKAIQDISIEL